MIPYDDSDKAITRQIVDWLDKGYEAALVTVIKTWGSSPRPAGSMLLMRKDGQFIGSVSGGCVEEDLVTRYRQNELSSHYPTMVNYGVDTRQASRLGLPCGGRLELFVEKADHHEHWRQILGELEQQTPVCRRVCLKSGVADLLAPRDMPDFQCDDSFLCKTFGPQWDLLLIGAGQLAQYVSHMALLLNYRVWICDPRYEHAVPGYAENVRWLAGMPDDVVREHAGHSRCAVVTLSHDPKLDDLALQEALKSDAFYIGALGSKRSQLKRQERLLQIGLSQDELHRLHAPVGLAIGGRTPAEIALSIMAEITQVRHQPILAGATLSLPR